jgi:hypothetical protein
MDRFASTIIMPFGANQIPEQPQPTRSPAIKRSRTDHFKPEPHEKILSKLLPPSSATLNVVDAYNVISIFVNLLFSKRLFLQTRVREVLKKEIGMYHYLQKLANDPNVPGTSNQTNCIGENPVTDEMRSTLDYINLKVYSNVICNIKKLKKHLPYSIWIYYFGNFNKKIKEKRSV